MIKMQAIKFISATVIAVISFGLTHVPYVSISTIALNDIVTTNVVSQESNIVNL